MRTIDEIHLKRPFLDVIRITDELEDYDWFINHKRVYRLMKLMGIMAIYPKPKLSEANPNHKIYPYLLRNLVINRPNQVWATDITYIPMAKGFIYLTVIMDWYSRKVVRPEFTRHFSGSQKIFVHRPLVRHVHCEYVVFLDCRTFQYN